jgi:hypothetical protein
MSRQTIAACGLVVAVFGSAGVLHAQDHSQHTQTTQPAKPAGGGAGMEDSASIFCPTMNAGQLCTHGSANNLGLSGPKVDQWREVARKYNRAVEAATNQLMKDAETLLTPEQMTQLKGWFAEGLNREINQLLYAKGLGKKQ